MACCHRYYDDSFIYGVSGATLQQKMGSEVRAHLSMTAFLLFTTYQSRVHKLSICKPSTLSII